MPPRKGSPPPRVLKELNHPLTTNTAIAQPSHLSRVTKRNVSVGRAKTPYSRSQIEAFTLALAVF